MNRLVKLLLLSLCFMGIDVAQASEATKALTTQKSGAAKPRPQSMMLQRSTSAVISKPKKSDITPFSGKSKVLGDEATEDAKFDTEFDITLKKIETKKKKDPKFAETLEDKWTKSTVKRANKSLKRAEKASQKFDETAQEFDASAAKAQESIKKTEATLRQIREQDKTTEEKVTQHSTKVEAIISVKSSKSRSNQTRQFLDGITEPEVKDALLLKFAEEAKNIRDPKEQLTFLSMLKQQASNQDSETALTVARTSHTLAADAVKSGKLSLSNPKDVELISQATDLNKVIEADIANKAEPAQSVAVVADALNVLKDSDGAQELANAAMQEKLTPAQQRMAKSQFLLTAAGEVTKIKDKKTREAEKQKLLAGAGNDSELKRSIELKLADETPPTRGQQLKKSTVRMLDKVGGMWPKTKGDANKKKRRILGGITIGVGLGLAIGLMATMIAVPIIMSQRNERESEMDQIKAEEGLTVASPEYQQMLQEDITRLEDDEYTVEVVRDENGNIIAYAASKENADSITFEDSDALIAAIDSMLAEAEKMQAEAEAIEPGEQKLDAEPAQQEEPDETVVEAFDE
ncbi:MAG: hypothetical protein H6679_04155 [Epsilonproteobacteria bacterium]|nr:hypothetical protein [Campylobacterota bacterium]